LIFDKAGNLYGTTYYGGSCVEAYGCDASLEFANFVLREFLTSNYSVEKHASDVYDQFQLRYLAVDRFIIVTDDSDLTKRTARSAFQNSL
jgi:hypothetical protein